MGIFERQNMSQILNINASPNFLCGKTKKITDSLIKILSNRINYLDYKNINLYEKKVLNCIGCTNCFQKGLCSLDGIDDVLEIKKDILKSDIIIYSTPVYLQNVTAILKSFLERISMWAHTMELSGKYLVVIITASSNGMEETLKYLYKISSYMGMFLIGVIRYDRLLNTKQIMYQIENCYENIIRVITLNDNIYSNNYLNKIYNDYKIIYQLNDDDMYENKIWKKNHFLGIENFDDAIRNKKDKKEEEKYYE